jgi:hypothetical protein
MGVELFGGGAVVYFATACVIAYVFSSHRGIYGAQRVGVAKGDETVEPDAILRQLHAARRHWLPPRRSADDPID